MSGGLDSQLAVRVLQEAGAEVEGVCFETPFFSSAAARRALLAAIREAFNAEHPDAVTRLKELTEET